MKTKCALIVFAVLLAASVPAVRADQAEPEAAPKPAASVQNARPFLMIFGRFGSFQPSSDIFKKVSGLHSISYRESNQLGSVEGSGLGYAVCGGVAARWRFLGLDARLKYASAKDTPVKEKADFSGLMFDIAVGIFLGRSLN